MGARKNFRKNLVGIIFSLYLWGGGWGYRLLNPLYMNVFIIALVVLVFISFVAGYINCHEMIIAFEFNLFNSPFYKLGVFSERFNLQDGQVEDEVTIGLFFVNVVFTFWRDNSEEDF